MSKDTLILTIVLALLVLFTVLPLLTRTSVDSNIELIGVNLTETNPWVGGCNEVVVKVTNNGDTAVRPGVLVVWNPGQISYWATSNESIPPHTTAVLVGYAPPGQVIPNQNYASVRVIDRNNPFHVWSSPVWTVCNISQPPVLDPFMNVTHYVTSYSIEYPYGWVPILYGTNIETIVNTTGFYAWVGNNTLLILEQGVAEPTSVFVHFTTNCTFALYTNNTLMQLNGTGIARETLVNEVAVVIPQNCFVHITMYPNVEFLLNEEQGGNQ
jgi:hypothetical protein